MTSWEAECHATGPHSCPSPEALQSGRLRSKLHCKIICATSLLSEYDHIADTRMYDLQAIHGFQQAA